MKQGPYWGLTDIRRHRTKSSRRGDLADGIDASSTRLYMYTLLNSVCMEAINPNRLTQQTECDWRSVPFVNVIW